MLWRARPCGFAVSIRLQCVKPGVLDPGTPLRGRCPTGPDEAVAVEFGGVPQAAPGLPSDV